MRGDPARHKNKDMNTTTQPQTEAAERSEHPEREPRAVTVTVNNKPVTFAVHKATGLEIKQTAIAQNVAIQADFVLFEVRGHGNRRQIGDNELVTLHPHQEFRAVAPDDNS